MYAVPPATAGDADVTEPPVDAVQARRSDPALAPPMPDSFVLKPVWDAPKRNEVQSHAVSVSTTTAATPTHRQQRPTVAPPPRAQIRTTSTTRRSGGGQSDQKVRRRFGGHATMERNRRRCRSRSVMRIAPSTQIVATVPAIRSSAYSS